ncbi:C40 family peptidase [Streptomyces sp. NRAIS4]
MAAPSATGGAPVQGARALPGTAVPGRPSPTVSKANNQRKLAAASDVISRYTAQLIASATAVQPMAVQPMAVQPPPVTTPPPETVTAAPPMPVTAAPPMAVATMPTSPVTTAVSPSAVAVTPTSPVTTAVPSVPVPAMPASPITTAAAPTAVTPMPPATVPGPPSAPITPAQPAPVQAAAGPGTGQWQQPQSAATGAVVSGMPAVEAWPAGVTAVADTGSLTPVPESRAAKAIAFARAQIGKPCVWGATGPDSYDCSSLTQAAWKAAGVTLPRAAHQQALAGAPVTLAGLAPGDLVLFFDDDRHVGLHVGGGMMVHAPGPGSSIREESIYGAGESAIHRIVRPA